MFHEFLVRLIIVSRDDASVCSDRNHFLAFLRYVDVRHGNTSRLVGSVEEQHLFSVGRCHFGVVGKVVVSEHDDIKPRYFFCYFLGLVFFV